MILFLNLIKLTKSDSLDHFEYLYSQNLLQAKWKHPHGPIYWQEAVINASGKLKGEQVWDEGWW